jgi:tRNA (cmo5U34)-methyltransferase
VLLDAAPAMLDRARGTLGDPNTTYRVADLREPLAAWNCDAVISALAIHHLHDPEKRDLFARIRDTLRPGGVFVNTEQIAAPNNTLQDRYRQWHRDTGLELGASTVEWAAAEQRMTLDRCSTVAAPLAWLSDAGFAKPTASSNPIASPCSTPAVPPDPTGAEHRLHG